MSGNKYKNIIVEVIGQIGVLYLNRPKTLNAFGDNLGEEVVLGLRELNEHPDTVFTVLTGKGRFFSSGADVRGTNPTATSSGLSGGQKKLASYSRYAVTLEMMRSVIDHKKVLILALNGPGVGGGAAWFQGVADIVFAAEGAWLQVPFSALGLVPENGSIVTLAQSIGVHRANEFLMFGKKLSVEELQTMGLVNTIFPAQDFHKHVIEYLQEQLNINDGKSMILTKQLANAPLRDQRMVAVYNAFDALAERSVDGASVDRFAARKNDLEAKSKSRSKL